MKYLAHKTQDGREQDIPAHLSGTAERARQNAIPMMKEICYAAGYAHDIGKYAEAFQERIQNGSKQRYEHALGGAFWYWNMCGKTLDPFQANMLAYCIAGHHTGLPDGGRRGESAEEPTLMGRMKRESQFKGKCDYHAFQEYITPIIPNSKELLSELSKYASMKPLDKFYEVMAFFTRYLFSCLTDADFLDTEHFCSPQISRETKSDFEEAEKSVQAKLKSFHAETQLQKARSRLQAQAFANAERSSGISILQMPVGSGKTLCSLEIALKKAVSSGKKRIIYVIPYTSIIEQTAEQFEALFGKSTDILQHHSNYDAGETAEPDTVQKLRMAAENWDMPVIVTTNVQFFESMYHYRSSRLRKLHNMADSVIVFDEVHMLPVEMLRPCLQAVGFLTKYMNSEAIFLSATMPDYTELFRDYLPDVPVHQLITDYTDSAYFRKCRYHDLGETDAEHIVQLAGEYRSSLIIVNKRQSAREIYSMLSGMKYHLSTYMTPYDRSKTIASIREALGSGEQVTVVSTSLIEAGVDLDFDAVFRELSGLDSILQSAGRCNREGRQEYGDVYIYQTADNISSELHQRAVITKDLLNNYEDIESTECIREYYRRLFELKKQEIADETIVSLQVRSSVDLKTGFISIPFRSYAESFNMIKDSGTGIIINNSDDTEKLFSELESGDFSAHRKLQKYTVSMRRYEFDEAMKSGLLMQRCGLYVLSDNAYYDPEIGLDIDANHDIII